MYEGKKMSFGICRKDGSESIAGIRVVKAFGAVSRAESFLARLKMKISKIQTKEWHR
jgi:hypothetical protein